MTSMTMLTQIQNPPNFVVFSQNRSYTDFDIKLYGFTRTLTWTFD